MNPQRDKRYIQLLLKPLAKCADYTPAFGRSGPSVKSVDDFQRMYASDPLYHWIGLDSPLMYAAHKAAGGMTSIYRQLGIGCERLFRAVIQDALELSDGHVKWGYDIEKKGGEKAHLELDAKIDRADVGGESRKRLDSFIQSAAKALKIDTGKMKLSGAVFEVRQGYKSADAKRQNADLRSATHAYTEGYLPVMAVFSTQMSQVVARRYRNAQMLVLTGTKDGTELDSTFQFCQHVVGYSLADFFERNHKHLRREFTLVLESLLSPG
jgi:hypothetical protein